MLRIDFIKEIDKLFKVNPAVALLGPRQCGKTTLAKQYLEEKHISAFKHRMGFLLRVSYITKVIKYHPNMVYTIRRWTDYPALFEKLCE